MEKLLAVTKVGNDPPMYRFWSKDDAEQRRGYMGRMQFMREEDVRKMLMTNSNLSEVEANAELSKVDQA